MAADGRARGAISAVLDFFVTFFVKKKVRRKERNILLIRIRLIRTHQQHIFIKKIKNALFSLFIDAFRHHFFPRYSFKEIIHRQNIFLVHLQNRYG